MIIYKATNLENNKVYIGQTINKLSTRKQEHIKRSKYDKYLTYFGKALRKYGEKAFLWETIDKASTQEELNKKESYWIEYYAATNPQIGYNLKGGGEKPYLTEEVKKKISEAQIGELNHMYGIKGKDNPSSIPVINITKNRIYASATECAEIEKISISKVCAVCRGDRASTNYCIYRYLDKDENIVEPYVKMKVKNIRVVNLDTNEIFNSIKDAQRKYDKHTHDALIQALKRGNGSCIWKEYRWKYENVFVDDIKKIVKKTRSDAKRIINLDTNEIYPSITAVGKNYRNLATALRKGNGECIYKKQHWKILNSN